MTKARQLIQTNGAAFTRVRNKAIWLSDKHAKNQIEFWAKILLREDTLM